MEGFQAFMSSIHGMTQVRLGKVHTCRAQCFSLLRQAPSTARGLTAAMQGIVQPQGQAV